MVGNLSTSSSGALYEVVKRCRADINRRSLNGKFGIAFRWPIEIDKNVPTIVCEVAVRYRESDRVNLESDPRLSLIDMPALSAIGRMSAAQKRHCDGA